MSMQTRKRARLRAHGWTDDRVAAHLVRWRLIARQRMIRLSEAQNHRCAYCGTRTWIMGLDDQGFRNAQATTEHVEAVTHGGGESRFNKVMACNGCNRKRGDMDAYAFHDGTLPPWRTKEAVIRRRSKRAAMPTDRLDAWVASGAYGGLILCLATIMHFDEEARRFVEDVLPGGRLAVVRKEKKAKREARRASFARSTAVAA